MKFLAMKKMYLLTSMLLVLCFIQDTFAQQIKMNPYKYETTKIVVCKNGAVVSAQALASQVGVNILKEGVMQLMRPLQHNFRWQLYFLRLAISVAVDLW